VSEDEGATGFPQIVVAEKYVISHHLGGVINQSFGATEQTFRSAAELFRQRAAYIEAAGPQFNVTVLAATGDNGASDAQTNMNLLYTYPVADWPASDPLVTGIGGTTLLLGRNGARKAPDQAWNDPGGLAGGGGKSEYFTLPSYQSGQLDMLGNERGEPDISLSAACSHPVDMYQSFGGQAPGWYTACGTSEAAPLFSGIVALADQLAGHPLGPINRYLYQMSAGHARGIVDVVRGNNTVMFSQDRGKCTVYGWAAAPGYDLASGVGTVDAARFVPELVALASAGHS
jgi:subtilase family serine protease